MHQVKMASGIAALDLNPNYRICQKFALEIQNSENFSLKKCKWLYSMFSHMPKYPTCLRKRLVILQQKGVHSDTGSDWPLIQPVKTKGNNLLYFHCPHFHSSCWEDVGSSEKELSHFISNSAAREREREREKFEATCCSCAQAYYRGTYILKL